jgi:Flp pilus assembly protein TadG
MMRRAGSLLRDERGNSIVELALVAPFLAALLVGMVDLSRGYSAKVQVTQAAQRAIEKAMQAEREDVNGENVGFFETLKAEGASAAGVAESAVAVKYWLECNGVSQNTSAATMNADYEKVCPSGQTYARYVTIDITKVYTPIFGKRFGSSNANGTYTLHGKAGIRVQ